MQLRTLLLLTFAFIALSSTAQTVTDYDGNVYNTVVIGSQRWMVQNLRTVHFNDGTPITKSESSFNSTEPMFCWYNNDSVANANPYGALYNWYAVNTGILCPAGWTVPSDQDWTTLSTFLGGDNVSGGSLKETGTSHWNSPNAGATNASGFTALPGGQRDRSNGVLFNWLGQTGLYWSTTLFIDGYTWYRGFSHLEATSSRGAMNSMAGISVRCIDSNAVGLNETMQKELKIHPNPTSKMLTISGLYNNNSEVAIFNTTGQKMNHYNTRDQELTIDISSLPHGIYIIQINGDKGTTQLKFIKQ